MKAFLLTFAAGSLLFAACTTSISGAGGNASGNCAQDADCGANQMCGFLASDACNAAGTCFPKPDFVCHAYSPGCACDGTGINVVCTGLPSGYVSKPLAHDGDCTSDGGKCCPVGWSMYPCTFPDGGAGLACHNPAMGCASSSTCGQSCDMIVTGQCSQ
jgi:hypothetical protein